MIWGSKEREAASIKETPDKRPAARARVDAKPGAALH
jgi:hypothetical protein